MSDVTEPGPRRSPARRMAYAIVRAAAHVVPSSQRHWATAMLHETAHTETGSEALRWAVGCLYAACIERTRSLYLLDSTAVRVAAALLASFRVLDVGMPTLLTLAYRVRSATVSSIGRLTPGDDYWRLVPLIEAIPGWLHAIVLLAVVLYVVAGVATWRRRSMAAGFWCSAILAEQWASFAARPILADVGVVVVQHPSVMAAVLLPIVMPALSAMAAWSGSRAASVQLP
jgi:hypothetical protein